MFKIYLMQNVKSLLLFITLTILPNKNLFAENLNEYIYRIYDKLELVDRGLEYDIFMYAVVGHYNTKNVFNLSRKNIVSIIDFSQSSNNDRLYIIDLKNERLLYQTLVAHGKNSGNEYAEVFSNISNTNKSSIGFYVTAEDYFGKHGLSLRLDGVDRGYNTNARNRAIVMHGADYVSYDFIEKYGRLGRSWGCPSIRNDLRWEILPLIKNKTLIFAYYPDSRYLRTSVYLNFENASINYNNSY